jgi:hypothetical protein
VELLSKAGKCIPRSNTPHGCPNHEAQGNFLVVLVMAGPTRAFRVNFRVHWLLWIQTKEATERSSLVYVVKTLTRDAEVLVKAQVGLRQATRNEVLPRSGLVPLVPASTAAADIATKEMTPETLRNLCTAATAPAKKVTGFWDRENTWAASTHPGFEPYPDLRWTSGPWKPSYEPWDFCPPYYCDLCNCLPEKCAHFDLHFSSDPVREAQCNAMLDGRNAFQAQADAKGGRTPSDWFPGSNQPEDPEAKRQCFQQGWDIAVQQAPVREVTLAKVAARRPEREQEIRANRAVRVLQRAQRSSRKNKKTFNLKLDAFFDAFNLELREDDAVRAVFRMKFSLW